MSTSSSVVEEFAELWERSETPPVVLEFVQERKLSRDQVLQVLLTDQHFRWRQRIPAPVTSYFQMIEGLQNEEDLKEELLIEEFGYWEAEQRSSDVDEFLAAVNLSDKDFEARIRAVLLDDVSNQSAAMRVNQPTASADQEQRPPDRLGRYQIERELGRGTFGRVFLANDTELHRVVAIKVPHQQHVSRAGGPGAFLAEARVVASIDAAGIVPVFDVGTEQDDLCYVVSKYIAGGNLATRMEQPISTIDAVRLVHSIAQTLHSAHRSGIVHRDIKPANILLDESGDPWLADFGLALVERNLSTDDGAGLIGTPAWMSPEQARGEGHRVDARSDVFSLGVVFYQLLTGQRPFQGSSTKELLREIRFADPRPPRQIDDSIPVELDRICLRAIAKRQSDRHSTAKDLAEDLQRWMDTATKSDTPDVTDKRRPSTSDESDTIDSGDSSNASQNRESTESDDAVIPPGLRSFGEQDAAAFLRLFPGPRDHRGVPDVIRFWIGKLQERDANATFPVGLVYGPSGSGKSSMIKAGVLPNLDANITNIYVEASTDQTETTLRDKLQNATSVTGVTGATLDGVLARLRQDSRGRKFVLVIDQFEHWLHAWNGEADNEMVRALRQCDGANVQAVLLVRDDFWMASTQFMRQLEIPLQERRNTAGVDLFDTQHAKNVLHIFGHAFNRLPRHVADLSPQQYAFLDQTIQLIQENGRVVPVRLAVIAELLRNQEWNSQTLREFGGPEEIGAAFLEQMFGRGAPPQNRLHARDARQVLGPIDARKCC